MNLEIAAVSTALYFGVYAFLTYKQVKSNMLTFLWKTMPPAWYLLTSSILLIYYILLFTYQCYWYLTITHCIAIVTAIVYFKHYKQIISNI